MKTHFEIVDEKPETHKWWVYVHTTPDNMHYVGVSAMKYTCQRWKPSHYKSTALQEYIERYGWAAIEHTVVAYVDNEKLALLYEEALMAEFAQQGTLINKQGSGGHWRDNDDVYKEYYREYWQSERGKAALRKAVAKYQKSDKGKAAQRKAYEKLRATPEFKIYSRVKAFNRYHPDLAIETPMEAKQKYLQYGYVPNYIKSDDL